MVVNQKELAQTLGISSRRVRALKEEGLFETSKSGRGYNLETCVQEYIEYKVNAELGRSASISKEKVQAEHEEVKKQISILKLRKLRRELHEAADVEYYLSDMLLRFKNRLLALPSKIVMEVSGLTDTNQMIQIIQKDLLDTMEELSEYDPEEIDQGIAVDSVELGMKLREHADKLGAHFKEDTVLKIEDQGPKEAKRVIGMNETYEARALILATGASHKKLGIPGETELAGAGVSYCATCDGAFFRNRTVAVIGGGDVAVEDAVFLSRMCSKVYLIHRRGELRAAKSLQNQLFSKENVEILWNMQAQAIEGDGTVERLILSENDTGEKKELSVQGVFIAVGIQPETKAFEGIVDMEQGYIKAEEEGITSAPGIFAAGDARTKKLRQIVTAAADGANAVTSAEQYLSDLKRG